MYVSLGDIKETEYVTSLSPLPAFLTLFFFFPLACSQNFTSLSAKVLGETVSTAFENLIFFCSCYVKYAKALKDAL